MSHYKPYPKYKDSGVEWIGDVPEGWEVERLRHISEFKNSSVDKKTYEGQAAVGLCNYTDVYYNEFITKDLPFMQATASPAEIEQFSLQKGDVIITKDSEDPSDIGIPALVADDVLGVVCGYHLTQIRTGDLNTARLIHRTMQSHVTQAYFFVEAPGITRYGLGQDTIGSVTICLPPLNHRGSVANWIDRETARIDAIIAKKTRFIELLKEKRSALITHAVTKGINPNVKMKDSGVEWIGEVPEHWTVCRLKHVARAIIGLTYSPEDVVDSKAGILVLRSSNIQNGLLDLSDTVRVDFDVPNDLYVCSGDILLCSRNGSRALIGKNIQLDTTTKGATFGAFMTIIRGQLNDFLYYVFNSTMFESQSALYMTSTVNQLTISVLDNMEVVIPPEKEMNKIVEEMRIVLLRVDLLSKKTQHSIDLLKERRSALITAAVTGQIDLRESA